MNVFAVVQSVKHSLIPLPRKPTQFRGEIGLTASRNLWTCSTKTHPFDCPVSYPREVITGKSKTCQQRQRPEQVGFDHGYSD
jgi:hypothetical protein